MFHVKLSKSFKKGDIMQISDIEFFATKFFEMCRQHPEICPHDFRFQSANTKTGIARYSCSLCGEMHEEYNSKWLTK